MLLTILLLIQRFAFSSCWPHYNFHVCRPCRRSHASIYDYQNQMKFHHSLTWYCPRQLRHKNQQKPWRNYIKVITLSSNLQKIYLFGRQVRISNRSLSIWTFFINGGQCWRIFLLIPYVVAKAGYLCSYVTPKMLDNKLNVSLTTSSQYSLSEYCLWNLQSTNSLEL